MLREIITYDESLGPILNVILEVFTSQASDFLSFFFLQPIKLHFRDWSYRKMD